MFICSAESAESCQHDSMQPLESGLTDGVIPLMLLGEFKCGNQISQFKDTD